MKCGINISTAYIVQHPVNAIINSLQQLGVDWIRLEFDWYHEQEVHELVHACKKHDINILGLLTGLVPGTVQSIFFDKEKYPNPYDELDSYLSFVSRTVKNYPTISHWEIWNEPNLYRFWRRKPKPHQYLEVVRQSSQLIRSIQPKTTIIMGSLCGTNQHSIGGSKKRFMSYIREIDHYVDGYGIHPYTMYSYIPLFRRSKKVLEPVKEMILEFRKEFPHKPTWVTEYGISTKYFVFNKTKIKKIYEELIQFSQENNIPFFLWHLLDTSHHKYSIFNPETKFGIFDKKLELKKLFK